jgi:hypothetical protein
MRVITDFPCFHVPMPWSRLALGEAGREMSRGTDLLEKAEKLDCNAARLPRHTHSLSREVLLADTPEAAARLKP